MREMKPSAKLLRIGQKTLDSAQRIKQSISGKRKRPDNKPEKNWLSRSMSEKMLANKQSKKETNAFEKSMRNDKEENMETNRKAI